MANLKVQPAAGVINASRINGTTGVMSFPNDLGAHAMVLNFVEYSFDRQAQTASTVLSNSIALPIPSNLVDSFSLRVNGTELGQLGGMASASASSFQTDLGGKDGFTLNSMGRAAQAGLEQAGLGTMIKSVAEKLDTGVIKGLEVAGGKAINPHLALSFDGVNLKTHSFEWELAPQTSGESDTLQRIVHKIKRSVLPSYNATTGRSYLDYPNAVDIFFLGTPSEHLYFFKRALVGQFSANYAGGGEPAFLTGGKPAVVKLSMELTEMDIHTKDDYEESFGSGGPTSTIGYGAR